MAAGGSFTPISAGTWNDNDGWYQAVGGTWSSSTHQFTASSVTTAASGHAASIDLSSIQRLLIGDSSTGWKLGESFAAASSSTLTTTATAISGDMLSALGGSLAFGQTVPGGWNLSADSDYSSGYPVYLSFEVGSGQSLDDLLMWQYSNGTWTEFSASDLTYDGDYASLTVAASALGVYAVTGAAVPEPATLLQLAAGLLGLLAPALWKKAIRGDATDRSLQPVHKRDAPKKTAGAAVKPAGSGFSST